MEVDPIKEAKHLKRTDDKCPACDGKLDLYSIFGMEFEGCPKCHGLWLVKDELRKLKNRVGIGQLHWLNHEVDNIDKTAAKPGERACPKCDGTRLLSVVFGKSAVVVDWCPKCHGTWLDRAEFDSIVEYLTSEAGSATRQDVEKEIGEDLKKLWEGGPEGRLAEVRDIAAAITTFLNFTIFEHPAVFRAMTNAAQAGRSIGMD